MSLAKTLAHVLRRRFFPSEADRNHQKWAADRGDATLRLDYPLGAESVVFDLGGHKGEWAKRIHDRYGARVLVFEPVPRFHSNIQSLFRGNPKVEAYGFGLAEKDGMIQMSLDENASSMIREVGKGNQQTVQLREMRTFLIEKGISRIDLIKINTEGAEFSLLEHMLDHGITDTSGNIQVQFHNFFPEARARMEAIQRRLSRTHTLTYQYPFIWENWRRNV